MARKDAEIIIAGGGIIGCAIAYYLSRAGRDVLIVERGQIGCQASSAAAGGLWPQSESHAPGPFLDLCLESNSMFPDLARELTEATGVDIEFVPSGLLHLLMDEREAEEAEELCRWQREGGLKVEMLSGDEVLERERMVSPAVRGGIFFEDDNHVNPLKLTMAFYLGAIKNGASSILETDVKGMEVSGGRVSSVMTDQGKLDCDILINAAGSWAGDIGEMAGSPTPVSPVRGQIVCTEPLPPIISSCIITSDVYLVQKVTGHVIVGSTREFVGYSKEVRYDSLEKLRRGAIEAVPLLSKTNFIRTWAGLRPFAPDELPILGYASEVRGLINATGHFRNGILLSPITGKLISELIIEGRASFPLGPFDASRFTR